VSVDVRCEAADVLKDCSTFIFRMIQFKTHGLLHP
jgi:hypothetical protein